MFSYMNHYFAGKKRRSKSQNAVFPTAPRTQNTCVKKRYGGQRHTTLQLTKPSPLVNTPAKAGSGWSNAASKQLKGKQIVDGDVRTDFNITKSYNQGHQKPDISNRPVRYDAGPSCSDLNPNKPHQNKRGGGSPPTHAHQQGQTNVEGMSYNI